MNLHSRFVRGGSGLRILVADDVPDAAEALSILLQFEGHEVSVAFGGTEAISLARSACPQVAILDIGMPYVDGYAVAQALRGETWGQDIYLIALTGRDDEASQQRAVTSGFQQYLIKPINPFQFLKKIGELDQSKS